MEIKELHLEATEKVVDVICDCCGNSCSKQFTDVEGQTYNVPEYMTLSAYWGYYSGKDLTKYTAHVCEKCVDEKFSFVKFKKEDYLL